MSTAISTNAGEVDTDTLSLDELRHLATNEGARQGQRLAEVPEVEDEREEEPAQIIYRREIDLGDGSGVQVFQADTLEQLVDKLAEAQKNATRKIRELNQASKPATQKPRQLSSDEEFIIGQELMSKPTAAFAKLFESQVGVPIEAFKTSWERVQAFEQAQAEQQAQNDFVAAHPEYLPNVNNGKRFLKYLQTFNMTLTLENLEKAYQELKSSGLLEVKPDSGSNTDATEVNQDTSRIVTPARTEVVQRTRASSGLSTRRGIVQRVNNEPSEDELENMPLDKLRELAIRSSRQ